MNRTEKKLSGSGGIDLYYAEWFVDAPRALVFVVHGLADHLGRHEKLVSRLVGERYAVAGIDLRGHGNSAGMRAYVGSFDLYVSDLTLAMGRARQLYPELPVVVFGHSMGALIATLYDVMTRPRLGGLILSSGAFLLPDSEWLQKASGLIGALAPRLPTVRIDTSKLSRDLSVARNADEDPRYFSGRIPARTAAEIVSAGELAREHAAEIGTPVLFIHGTADQITQPSGSELMYDSVLSEDKTLHLFPGLYHETFNELSGEAVLDLVVNWLGERF